MSDPDPPALAEDVIASIAALDDTSTASIRRVRAQASRRVADWPGDAVVGAALRLLDTHRWVAYELVYHHQEASRLLDRSLVLRFGRGMASWDAVDSFCRYIAGHAWQTGQLDDETVLSWTESPDRWWRRATLVSTVSLNLRAARGTGDRERTLEVCHRLVDDRDDMVVKALSWALRALVVWDPDAVRAFLSEYVGRVPARVRREVLNRLNTGLKNPRALSNSRTSAAYDAPY